MTLDGEDEAGLVQHSVRNVEHTGQIHLDVTAVVAKSAAGKIHHIKNEFSSRTESGAVGGGMPRTALAAIASASIRPNSASNSQQNCAGANVRNTLRGTVAACHSSAMDTFASPT